MFAAAFNNLGTILTDDERITLPDGAITDVNTATEAATGCPRAELIGRDFAAGLAKLKTVVEK